MPLTILSVAYPLGPVSRDAAGGAEQVLAQIDRGLVAGGHRSLVIALAGSEVAGALVPIAAPPAPFDDVTLGRVQARVREELDRVLDAERIDVIHLHGIDFPAYLPRPGPAVLATLHLPPSWYPPAALRPERPNTWVHGVSEAQHRACPPSPRLLPPIANGIDVEAFASRVSKRGFALFLGRICPEKGVHLALDAARIAGMPLLVAGEVFPYPAHRAYFDDEVAPRLSATARFLGPVGLARKRRLLAAARCVLIPSLAPETSSLVAREALAAGTPVVAFPNGALRDVVEPGRTGCLVEDVDGMARAIGDCAGLDSALCREAARRRFALRPMIDAYLALYEALARGDIAGEAGR